MGTERGQIAIHPLTEAMLHATDSVVMAAYGVPHSRKGSLRCYLDLQPEGSFVAFLEETIVGFGAVIDYGRFAYVGLMSVHPALQKRGVGGALLTHCLSWADKRHCPTILLDATPAGFPLYQSCGFSEAIALLEHYGFTPQRSLSHMRKGQPVQRSRQQMLYGQTSLGLG